MVSVTARQSDAIKTLEKLIEVSEVDLDVWEVSQHETRSWNAFYKDDERNKAVVVPMFSVSAKFKRREDAGLKKAVEEALNKMESHAPQYSSYDRQNIARNEDKHLLELILPDLHLGMLSWDRETGEDYDSYIASDRYRTAISGLIERTKPFRIDKILLVVGNDYLHTDEEINGKGGATTRGTPQDVDSRRAKMVEMGCDLMVETIDRLLEVAPVKVVAVPGNHDYTETTNVARYVKAWYRNCDDVEVNAEPTPRKYERYGNTLIGFTHGSEEKRKNLPMIMAQEKRMEWAETKFHEFHLGHIHRKKEYSTLSVNEEVGVRTRYLSALTGIDSWHKKQGYVANVRAAEAFVWNHEEGLAAVISWNAPRFDEN